MNENNYERELPAGYRQVFYLNAKDKKVGIIFNLIALVVLVLVLAAASIPLEMAPDLSYSVEFDPNQILIATWIFLLVMLLYIVLHELVHGIAYKALTGEKLTFGISWSCAFCGVPNIFVYRKAAIISAAAPLVVFTLIFLPVTAALYFVNPFIYFLGAVLLGMHLGGCCGDIYLICLLSWKFKNERTLVKDTGPEQFIYVPAESR